MPEIIAVAWGIDKSYLLQAFVVMKSILIHSKESYEFHVLSYDDIGEEIQDFEKMLKKSHSNFTVTFHKISSQTFSEVNILNSHLSIAAYNRLLIPEVLMEYKKCIYLDCDILVNGDLKELFQYEIGDNYIAGVRDNNLIVMDENRRKHMQRLGIPSMNTYVNSGVLIMNLDRLRKDNIVEKFLTQSQKDNLFEDQDVINVCCYGAIAILPLKYNLFHFYSGKNIKALFYRDYKESDFEFDWEKPFILHMGGFYKPWLSMRFVGADEWWEYADDFSESLIYRQTKALLDNNPVVEKMDTRHLANKARKYNRVFVWGYTRLGKEICDFLKKAEVEVDGILDNNPVFFGESYGGIEIIPPSKIKTESQDACFIVAVVKKINKEQIIQQLKGFSVREEQIIFADGYKKDILYYMAVVPEYYAQLLNDILYFELGETHECDVENFMKVPNLYPQLYYKLYKKYGLREWLERC